MYFLATCLLLRNVYSYHLHILILDSFFAVEFFVYWIVIPCWMNILHIYFLPFCRLSLHCWFFPLLCWRFLVWYNPTCLYLLLSRVLLRSYLWNLCPDQCPKMLPPVFTCSSFSQDFFSLKSFMKFFFFLSRTTEILKKKLNILNL